MDELEVVQRTDLREYLNILYRRKLVIVLTVVVVLGLALAYSFYKTPIYSATTAVLVPQQQANSALNIQNSQLQNPQSLQRSLADEQQFATGDAVKQAARRVLGVLPSVSVGTSSTADVLLFTAHSTDKVTAARISNAYANAYITARRANQVSQYAQQVTALQTSIAQLQAKANALSPSDPQRSALQQAITTLTQTVQQTQAASQVASQVGPTVVRAAVVPSSPSSPNPIRNGILAFLVGLILGVGLAFLVERLDDGVNSQEAAVRAADGLPVVGFIPMVPAWRTKGSYHLALVEDPNSRVSEAYRTLRTAIQFLSIDDPKRVLGITSSVPGEGKTTAVANLAISFARAGQRVIVVSCDMRRPRIHEFFGVSNDTGLTTVLIGQAELADAIAPVKGEPLLRILPSGPVPPNPAEILSSDRVRELIDVLADNADIVLLDCPPVLPVSDALLLSRLTDGMLVVTSAKSTSRRQLHRTVEMLQLVQAPVLGTILNRIPADGGYGYGYGYYGRYEAVSTNGSKGAPTTSTVESAVGPLRGRSRTQTMDTQPVSDGEPVSNGGATTVGGSAQPEAEGAYPVRSRPASREPEDRNLDLE